MISCITRYAGSSIGKKQILGFTGFLLSLFLLGHLSGNFLLFKGPDVYNAYAQSLQSLGLLLYLMRLGMITLFSLHIFLMGWATLQNYRARPVKYLVKKSSPERSWATQTMFISGIVVFFYLLVHLADFTFAAHYGPAATLKGQDLGLFGLVVNTFSSFFHSFMYIVAMLVLGFHVSHGIQSIAQTIGLSHPVYTPWIKHFSTLAGIVVAVGFSSIPLYVLFRY